MVPLHMTRAVLASSMLEGVGSVAVLGATYFGQLVSDRFGSG